MTKPKLLPCLTRLGEKRREKFLEAYHRGDTLREIAEDFNVEYQRIQLWVDNLIECGYIARKRKHGKVKSTYFQKPKKGGHNNVSPAQALWAATALKMETIKVHYGEALEVLGAPGAELYRIAGDSRIYTQAGLIEAYTAGLKNKTIIQGGRK